MIWVHAPLAELTCKELTIANKYWNTTVSELTLKSPSTHVVPSKGINISAALTPDLKNRMKYGPKICFASLLFNLLLE